MNRRVALLYSALFGFTALSQEILWYRAYSFANAGRASAFGVLLGAYLLGIALGSRAVEASFTAGEPPTDEHRRMLVKVAFGSAVAAYLALPLYSLFLGWAGGGERLPFFALLAAFMGASFPLLGHVSIRPDQRAGSELSYLYLANIVGSTSGSLLTGFLLLDVWPLATVALFLLVVGLAMAAGLVLAGGFQSRTRAGALGAIALVALGATAMNERVFHRFYERLQWKTLWPAPFAHVVETRSGVITVDASGRIYGGGEYDGAFNVDLENDKNGIKRAFLAGAVHPRPGTVLVIGLSSGSWAQVLANHPEVEKVVIVEINRGYLDLLPRYPEVGGLLTNPKVEIIVDDGRRWLARSDARFDLIVANATQHWRGHAANLLSREFVTLVKGALADGGLYVFNATGSLSAERTAVEEFRHAAHLAGAIAVSDSPIALDANRWRTLLSSWAIDGTPLFDPASEKDRRLLAHVVERASVLVSGTRESLLATAGDAPVVTDDNMYCEWHGRE